MPTSSPTANAADHSSGGIEAKAATHIEQLAAALAPLVADLVAEKMRLDNMAGDDLILTTPDAAKLIGVAERTLENWRADGSGPKYLKIGSRAVGYRLGDVREWISARPARGRRSLLSLVKN